ncbi:NS protein [Avian orthoreovirus]|uniref:NS protein n=1 Tax=Avian orthoreovirus TaxID=38170 RepID=A0A1J0M4Y5_9REOV|nr:NS protein [Avian orthoreovirus]
MQNLLSTTFEVRYFEFSPFGFEECATPSFTAVTDTDPVKYFNIEFPSNHRLSPFIPDLLSRPCRVHVSLVRRFSLYSSLSDICEYDCVLLPSVNAIVPSPPSSTSSAIIIHWDGRFNSVTAKRSRGIDTLVDFERDYKSWRSSTTS